MDQVFDFREFILKLWRKFRLALLLGLIFAILGGAFGYIKYPDGDLIRTTSTANVTMNDKTKDPTALTNAMLTINPVISNDTFYLGLLQELGKTLEQDQLDDLFLGDVTPKIEDMKEVINVYTKGNVVFADVTSTNKTIADVASLSCINYSIKQITMFSDGVTAKLLEQQSVNMTEQNNDSKLKSIMLYTIFGFAGGIVLAILLIFFIDIVDLRVKHLDDLKRFGLPVLGDFTVKKK